MTKEEVREYNKKYYEANKEKNRAKAREYYSKNKKQRIKYSAEYAKSHPEKKKKGQDKYRAAHREDLNKKQKEYQKKNKDSENKRRRSYFKTNFIAKLSKSVKSRILNAIKAQGASRQAKYLELIGCSLSELKTYLEKQFKTGMSWENHGRTGWHIDHIRPCCLFDLSDEKQQKICFNYTNLQPLWATENLIKKKKDNQVKNEAKQTRVKT